MNRKKVIGATMLVSVFFLGSISVVAKEQDADSKARILFKANEEPTEPVNPIDPDAPVDPTNPIDPEDPNNPGTGSEGPLTIDYVSNIKFGEKDIKSGDTIYYAMNENPFVQVTDKRGTGAGWTLTAQTQGFKTETGKQLKGSELTFKQGQIKTRSGNVSAPAEGRDVTFNNNDAKIVMLAKKDAGRGTWLDVFSGEVNNNENIQLKVLEGSADANVDYSAEINWVLANIPNE